MDPKILAKSVTQGDYSDNPYGAIFLSVGSWFRPGGLLPDLSNLSFRESDYMTVSTVDYEAVWAGAVAIAVTKVASLAWEVESDIPLRTKRGQELLLGSDAGNGWVSFISKILQDFLLTNNGCFVEIVRATTSVNSSIIGLIPLDSLRCTRTGDPEHPVIYQDLRGAQHELRAEDVIMMADMPSSRASLFGSGKCAAARAYSSIYKLACIESYVSDKVSGRRPLAVHLINGLNDPQLKSVLLTAQSEADSRGVVAYMGAIMATVPGETTPGVATIPLADFPDNFDRKVELDISVLAYADNIGLDIQDLQPLTGQALGTGAQSQVLNEKAKGKGLSAFRQQFVHSINTWVLPDLTTMVFVEKDWRDKQQAADVNKTIEAYTSDAVAKGILTPQQGLQAMVDDDIYPKQYLPVDQTPDTSLSDTEKPEEEPIIQDEAAPAVGAPPVPAPENTPAKLPPEIMAIIQNAKTKATSVDEITRLLKSTYPDARKLAEKIRKESDNA